jgi:hypothetical protein
MAIIYHIFIWNYRSESGNIFEIFYARLQMRKSWFQI